MMTLNDVRLVWLEKQDQWGFAIELVGNKKAQFTGRIRLTPDMSREEVIKSLRDLANSLEADVVLAMEEPTK